LKQPHHAAACQNGAARSVTHRQRERRHKPE
jgi:hypothetical protein